MKVVNLTPHKSRNPFHFLGHFNLFEHCYQSGKTSKEYCFGRATDFTMKINSLFFHKTRLRIPNDNEIREIEEELEREGIPIIPVKEALEMPIKEFKEKMLERIRKLWEKDNNKNQGGKR